MDAAMVAEVEGPGGTKRLAAPVEDDEAEADAEELEARMEREAEAVVEAVGIFAVCAPPKNREAVPADGMRLTAAQMS